MGSYALRIEQVATEPSGENPVQGNSLQDVAGVGDVGSASTGSIQFEIGNPRVELLVGLVHLYRDLVRFVLCHPLAHKSQHYLSLCMALRMTIKIHRERPSVAHFVA